MHSPLEFLLVLVLLSNLVLLSTGRLRPCIRISAVQGVLLGLLPLLVTAHGSRFQLPVIAVVTLALKGLVFPRLLFRSLRTSNARQEIDPLVGYTASTLIGIAIVAGSFWLGSRFPLPENVPFNSRLVLPIALATMLCGLFLIVSRHQALMQVVGYLVLENGIYIFGVALAHEEPLLIEMGILLDVFVAVFVMGIALFHIGHTFDHIDVDQLTQLKD